MMTGAEVVFGANAIQGLGATGGIINYVTASPPDSRVGYLLTASIQREAHRTLDAYNRLPTAAFSTNVRD